MNQKNIITSIVDIVLFSVYSLLGGFLCPFWGLEIFGGNRLTGDPFVNFLFALSVPLHFLLGVMVSRFFYKKEKINKSIFIVNIVLMFGFYAYCFISTEFSSTTLI